MITETLWRCQRLLDKKTDRPYLGSCTVDAKHECSNKPSAY